MSRAFSWTRLESAGSANKLGTLVGKYLSELVCCALDQFGCQRVDYWDHDLTSESLGQSRARQNFQTFFDDSSEGKLSMWDVWKITGWTKDLVWKFIGRTGDFSEEFEKILNFARKDIFTSGRKCWPEVNIFWWSQFSFQYLTGNSYEMKIKFKN